MRMTGRDGVALEVSSSSSFPQGPSRTCGTCRDFAPFMDDLNEGICLHSKRPRVHRDQGCIFKDGWMPR